MDIDNRIYDDDTKKCLNKLNQAVSYYIQRINELENELDFYKNAYENRIDAFLKKSNTSDSTSKQPNSLIRYEIYAHNIKKWQIAKKLGITDSTFSKMLRKELSEEKKNQILLIIDELIENIEE